MRWYIMAVRKHSSVLQRRTNPDAYRIQSEFARAVISMPLCKCRVQQQRRFRGHFRTRQRHWNIGGSQVERRRRENRGAVSGEGCASGDGLCPFPENLWIFHLKMVWYGAHKMTATCGIQKFRWREKIKHLSKYWGSSTHDDPCRSNIGGSDPCNLCGIDAYGHFRLSIWPTQCARIAESWNRCQVIFC